MSVAETNARAFRLALAMDRMAEMRLCVDTEPAVGGSVWTHDDETSAGSSGFDLGSADSLAEAVARLWERREQRLKTEKEQSNDDQE